MYLVYAFTFQEAFIYIGVCREEEKGEVYNLHVRGLDKSTSKFFLAPGEKITYEEIDILPYDVALPYIDTLKTYYSEQCGLQIVEPFTSEEVVKYKTCRRCGIEKATNLFSPAPKNSDRLHSWCKACKATWMKLKRNLNNNRVE